MMSELYRFEDIPEYILSGRIERDSSRGTILSLLKKEVDEVRKPWGEIEPFIVALYHSIFVLEDLEIGELLAEYLNKVQNKYKHSWSRETREIIEIVLIASELKLGKITKTYAIKAIETINVSTPLSNLVKVVVIIEITGEYNPEISVMLEKLRSYNKIKNQFFYRLSSEPDAKEIAQHYLIDLDRDKFLTFEDVFNVSFFQYFVDRANRLQEEFEIRRKLLVLLEQEYESLIQEYKSYYNSLLNKIAKFMFIPTLMSLLFPEKPRKALEPWVKLVLLKILRYYLIKFSSKGRNLRRKIKHKKIAIKELHSVLHKLK